MAGFLTTHVLDTAQGKPAAGMTIDLFRLTDQGWQHLKTLETNKDGRTDAPALPEGEFALGDYELLFHIGDYFKGESVAKDRPGFLTSVPVRFTMSEEGHYHVPLLASPFGYSTYRGS